MKPERRILIIEDNPDDEALLLRQLKKAELDRHIRVIPDGGKALTYLLNTKYQCEELAAVFLDLKLPTLSGLNILETIRFTERLENLAVIVMTSSNEPDELARCKELGVSCFVEKPLTFSSFAKAFADTFHAQRMYIAPVREEIVVAVHE
jgi:two-component system response regulator